jgi:DHA1 family bicyclomycin/chloramphenicol resistance-like MFS transporter
MTTPATLTARLYGVLGLVAMLAPLATSFYLPGLPELAADLDASVSQAQLTVSSALIGLAAGQFVLGSVSDRFGRRRPMIIGMAVFAAATLLCAAAPNIWVLVVLRAIQGFAGAAGPVIGRASIRDLTSGTATAQALSRLLAIIGLAPVLGPLVGGLVLTFTTWRGLFVALGAIGLISLVAAVGWFPETLPGERRIGHGPSSTSAAFRELLTDPRVLVALGITSLLGIVSFSWSATSPFYFIEGYGISPQWYAATVAMNSAMFVVGAYVNSRAVGRLGARDALRRGLSLMLVGVSLFAVTTVVWAPVAWPIALIVLTMGAYGGMIANAQVLGLGPHGQVAGTMSALLGTAQFLGGAIVPPIVTAGLGPIAALPVLLVGATGAALMLVAWGVRSR